MDPITLAIVGAIAAGVTAAGGKVVEDAITSGYAGLKKLLIKKYGQEHKVVRAVDDLEEQPTSTARRAVLAEEVKISKADKDAELVEAANHLKSKLENTDKGKTIITQIVSGSKNIFTGTGNVIFHDEDERE
jgi:hypothetical protein